MFGKLIDTVLKAPGDVARAAAETAVAERAIDGAERGIDKLADPSAPARRSARRGRRP